MKLRREARPPHVLHKLISALLRISHWLEDLALVAILSALMLLAASQIILRLGFDYGFVWSDELLRLLVLWIAMLGSLAASRERKHIRIDVLSRFLPERGKLVAGAATDLFAAVVCGVLAWHTARFVRDAREFGDTLLGDWPAWPFQLVMPVVFGLIATRYGLFGLRRVVGLATRKGSA